MTGPTRSAETAPNEHAHAALSDEALMRRIATGDHLAMRTLYARHSTLLFRFAHRLLGDSTSAEDVRAEVFLAVWRQAGRFEARCSVSTWLLAITRNKALSSLRRTREVYLDAEAAALVPDPADDAETNVLKKDRDDILRRATGRLPRKQAEVIDLVYYHGKSIAEVAQILGIPENTVKTRMHHARKRLAAWLEVEHLIDPPVQAG
jgi:RNA polymerase sigma-70 factor, ECF subfamily